MIPGRGLILVPGPGNSIAKLSDKIKIIRPGKTIIETAIRGVSFNNNRDILIDHFFTKEDVRIGSEVWVNQ